MPVLNLSELNIVVSVAGGFLLAFGIVSVKLKQTWYLGEALPAMLFGIILGPMAGRLLQTEKWGTATEGQTRDITLGLTRVVIGLQLVIVGYQLPAQYNVKRIKELFMCLIPVMTIMWLATTLCMLATIPKITLLAGLAIASCVTCTDPVLSQAVAKGPFADKYVARHLREIISAEAGLNDGFGFPFLMLAVYLMRHASGKDTESTTNSSDTGHNLMARAEDVSRQGGGPGVAIKNWVLETWLYFVVLSAVYGIVVGTLARYGIKYALRKRWIDGESYVLFPTALGLFLVGTCGAIGVDDLLSCAVAGHALNWDGEYLRETERRHDEVNSCIDVLLNFGGFMYIGAIIPWSEFHDPEGTGITIGRLFGMAFMVLVLRRIPAIFMAYKLMPAVVANWREALFMGYFGPIGIGAVFYLEHARHLDDLVRALGPCIYFLVVFSIIVHGLSIPALAVAYKYMGVQPIKEDSVEIRRKSLRQATPSNAVDGDDDYFIAYNRFSRPVFDPEDLPFSRANSMARSIAPSIRPSFSHSRPPPENRTGADANFSNGDMEKPRRTSRTIRYDDDETRGRTIKYDDDV
ncbi:hypothetical protein NLU13_8755 [Sarocladium strictum]|uniref:Cation/H+ exchanger transmembrane domain-containing protein n=1 Tax=Sarocladium strictum TaxID=5046 RepID=A0AA39GDS4_SARSR|nr:hypothetical protein NLU13_8755 [Sarocladium strictum]